MAYTILVTALVIDESNGTIEDSNVTLANGQSQATVDSFVVALEKLGEEQTKAALASGVKSSQIKQHRQTGRGHGHGHGKP